MSNQIKTIITILIVGLGLLISKPVYAWDCLTGGDHLRADFNFESDSIKYG